MADNTLLSIGSGGDTVRDKDRAGVKTTIVGLDLNIGGGSESLMAGAMPVTGTFWQSLQPVSIAATVHVDDAAGSLTVDNAGTFPVQVSSALPAGTNLIGQAAASNETGTIYSGTTALVPKFATFNLSATGTVVALVGGKRIRVLRWRVSANGTVNVKWQSHVTPTDISGLSYCVAGKDCGGGFCPVGHFQTVSGEALDLNLSAGISVSGELTYVEV